MSVSTPQLTDRLPAQFYYLDHFHTALSWLEERYGDLLSPAESEFIAEFLRLPRASQALLVRLIMRRGQRFRATKINYPEIGPIDAAIGALIELRWIDPHGLLSMDDLVKLITRAELAEIFTDLPAGLAKTEMHALLRERYTEARAFEEWRGNVNERVYWVTIAPLCTQLRILFFGNFRQEWSEFVLADLGVFKYEAVPFSKDSRPFGTRCDIESFYALYECRRRLHEEEPLQEVLAQVPKVSLQHEWLEGRRAKLQLLSRRQTLPASRSPAGIVTPWRSRPRRKNCRKAARRRKNSSASGSASSERWVCRRRRAGLRLALPASI